MVTLNVGIGRLAGKGASRVGHPARSICRMPNVDAGTPRVVPVVQDIAQEGWLHISQITNHKWHNKQAIEGVAAPVVRNCSPCEKGSARLTRKNAGDPITFPIESRKRQEQQVVRGEHARCGQLR